MTLADRKKIEDHLEKGDKNLIAKASGKSRETIRRWFRADGENYVIESAAKALYKKRVEQADQASKEVVK